MRRKKTQLSFQGSKINDQVRNAAIRISLKKRHVLLPEVYMDGPFNGIFKLILEKSIVVKFGFMIVFPKFFQMPNHFLSFLECPTAILVIYSVSSGTSSCISIKKSTSLMIGVAPNLPEAYHLSNGFSVRRPLISEHTYNSVAPNSSFSVNHS